MTKLPVYLDHFATTPVDPRVLEAMLPFFMERFGNAGSTAHAYGWDAEEAVERARSHLAALVNGKPSEIIFTSGATESNNLAIKGLAESRMGQGGHVITLATEHKSVLVPCEWLAKNGFEVTVLPVAQDGLVDLNRLEAAINSRTFLVSVMYANNETGVVQPIAEIGRLTAGRGVAFHCDATQALGKIPVDVNRDGIDLMSFSAHKMYGPKGVGGLYAGSGPKLRAFAAQILGGGQERGIRSGTLNVPGIVGMARAAELNSLEMEAENTRIKSLRDHLQNTLVEGLSGLKINGNQHHRLPGALSASFEDIEGDELIRSLPGIALSRGSSCSGHSRTPSHVLKALGLSDRLAQGTLRLSLGRSNTRDETDFVAAEIISAVQKLRKF